MWLGAKNVGKIKNDLPLPQMFPLTKTAVPAEDLKMSEASRKLKCSTVSESWDLSRPRVKNWSTRTSAIRTLSVSSWVTRSLTFENQFCSWWIFYSLLSTVLSCETSPYLLLLVRDFDAAGSRPGRGRRCDTGDRGRHSAHPLGAVRERHAPQGKKTITSRDAIQSRHR